jgi:hypothetical protein
MYACWILSHPPQDLQEDVARGVSEASLAQLVQLALLANLALKASKAYPV